MTQEKGAGELTKGVLSAEDVEKAEGRPAPFKKKDAAAEAPAAASDAAAVPAKKKKKKKKAASAGVAGAGPSATFPPFHCNAYLPLHCTVQYLHPYGPMLLSMCIASHVWLQLLQMQVRRVVQTQLQ